MHTSARENYLVTEVLTATPQKLHLMLVEATIRSVTQAKQKWQEGEDEDACERLIHAQECISQILGGLDQEAAPDLVSKIAAIYMFIFRSLMEANFERDEKKAEDALRVLNQERETWRQVCEKVGTTESKATVFEETAIEEKGGAIAAPAFPTVDFTSNDTPVAPLVDDLPGGGFSLEA